MPNNSTTHWCVVCLCFHELITQQFYLLTQLVFLVFAFGELGLIELQTTYPLSQM